MAGPPSAPPRIITATALFDGHDAAINLVRRLLVGHGAQVVHLGHNRSVAEIVKAAVEEDADAVCVSSYQGGHMAFFPYLVQRLQAAGAAAVRVFGGGGGVILPEEVATLEAAGVEKLYTPGDGQRLGLDGMIQDLLARIPRHVEQANEQEWADSHGAGGDPPGAAVWAGPARMALARRLSAALAGPAAPAPEAGAGAEAPEPGAGAEAPVVGFTGPGGAGKSSLCDEVVRRLLEDFPELRVAILAIDPIRRSSGGALLGDRLRMNSASDPRVYFRSLAGGPDTVSAVRRAAALLRRVCGLVLLETSGIGQGDSDLADLAEMSVYVMTSEFGAGTQLEKINMLDLAHMVVINKFENARAEDALQAVRRQFRRNHALAESVPDLRLPVYGTVASRFDDPGVDRFYLDLLSLMAASGPAWRSPRPDPGPAAFHYQRGAPLLPEQRSHYLREIVAAVRGYRARTGALETAADRLQALETAAAELADTPEGPALRARAAQARAALDPDGQALLAEWTTLRQAPEGPDGDPRSPSGTRLPRVALPDTDHLGAIIRYLRQENVPGRFPFTAGAWTQRRTDEEPKRQFAGEGGPERTNRRFQFLCRGESSRRLSTAFDSVTLYGEDPQRRPDIHGKIGESGVSVATLDDMKQLFAGFDLADPATSVSMTINGPAPVLLAMFFNTAIDQQLARQAAGAEPGPDAAARIRRDTLAALRGTVQADILKEDQAQNTCIFSLEFALRLMGDVQAFLVDHGMRRYYSVSVSGYHIAEAGADPVTQLAFTLANGFTLLEYFLARGLAVDAVAPSLSFFFSSGLDPEYAVLGRVARRIWAIALRDVYHAAEPSRRLKYHVQTSGRSLHLQDMAFNDIRTTLQAFTALADNCNSLHTNAHDEALTTPTEASVRLAQAIQLVITREFGLYRSENLLQGSHFLQRLSDDVEAAVLAEFTRLDARGGVLRAMETQYQRGRIQEESLRYETRKHSGELAVVGVNTFVQPGPAEAPEAPVVRASPQEKDERLRQVQAFHDRHRAEAGPALERLREQVRRGGNVFDTLMETVRVASLGQITAVLYEMGGKYRRSM